MRDSFILRARGIASLDDRSTEADWMLIEDGRVSALGSGEAPSGKTVRSEGYVFPGFIDAHVHLTTTGLYEGGLDFRECRTVPELLTALDLGLRGNPAGWIVGGNFDPGRNADTRMPVRQELDALSRDRRLLISRADGHSCAVNTVAFETIALKEDTAGIELDSGGVPTGVLRNQANYRARQIFFSKLPADVLAKAQADGCKLALSKGVTSVHEMAGGSYMGNKDFEVLMANREQYPIHVLPYLSTFDLAIVIEHGLPCVGGDLFLDGSIGSRTAAMTVPYEDGGENGSLYHDDVEVTEFFEAAGKANLQAGVHAIGDAAIGQAIRCMEAAALSLPEGEFVKLRHRIEHFECVGVEHLAKAVRLGIIPSVQPAFDAYWGGNGMYRARLGKRADAMNPFSEMIGLGLRPAGGSDSTVTPLDPLFGISAAAGHRTERYRTSVTDALKMFTIWAAAAGREESERGTLEPGKMADCVVLSHDPRSMSPSEVARVRVLETWVAGEKMFSE